MKSTRLLIATFLLAGLTGVACGPAVHSDLTIRPDYTSESASQAFQRRYLLANDLPPGPPVTVEETGAVFASLQQASQEAPDGATLRLGEGFYKDSFLVSGKTLRIVGQGRFKTVILSPESVGLVQRGTAEIFGVTLASLSLKQDAPVLGVVDGTLNMQECRLTGGTGPALTIVGDSQVYLLANTFAGNMGGGIRLQGGTLDMRRNVIVRNAVAGLLLAPAKPGAITRLTLWHDVILDNWAGYRCQAFAKSGIVPLSGQEIIRVEASILNSGGMSETFSEAVALKIKSDGYNFVSTPPLPIADFFMDYDNEDFRPKGALKTDELGVELGAWPTETGMGQILSILNIALSTERLREAYLLSAFLAPADREAVGRRIQELVAYWTGEFLQSGRLGTRLVTILNLAQVAPPAWRMDVILQRFMEGFVQRYTYVLRPVNFFDDNTQVSQAAFSFLEEHLAAFPRFLTVTGDFTNAFVLSGRISLPVKVNNSSSPFKLEQTVDNPQYPKLVDAIQLAKSRQVETQKKVKETQDTINSPHFKQKVGENSKHMANLKKQLAKFEEELAGVEETLKALLAQLERSPKQFKIQAQGKEHKTRVNGEFSAQLVLAPLGDILMDTTRPLELGDSRVEASPVPQFGFAGTTAGPATLDVPKLLGSEIGRLLLEALITKETEVLGQLLKKYDDGVIAAAEEDQLIELLLLNAVLIRDSLQARQEYDRLTANPPRTDVRLDIGFDDKAGTGPESVRMSVRAGDDDGSIARIRYLKSVYEPYWNLQKAIDRFLTVRFGLTRDDLLTLRNRLDQFGPKRDSLQ